jgi:hypothetical protein
VVKKSIPPLIALGIGVTSCNFELKARRSKNTPNFQNIETNCRLRHSIYIRYSGFPVADLGRERTKLNLIFMDDVLLAEETKINDNTRIRLWTNIAIRECIAVNLDVPRKVLGAWDHNLRLRITERNRKRVLGVSLPMLLDPLGKTRIFGDGLDYGTL